MWRWEEVYLPAPNGGVPTPYQLILIEGNANILSGVDIRITTDHRDIYGYIFLSEGVRAGRIPNTQDIAQDIHHITYYTYYIHSLYVYPCITSISAFRPGIPPSLPFVAAIYRPATLYRQIRLRVLQAA